jgi:radical SAM family uncharacterized protein/radical SAM-linked protein
MTHIDPLRDLRRDLASILNPVRYLGGEYGQIVKDSADLTFALAFPDLYEIAMSNLAIKVIYDGLNRLPSVRCERVFAPAPDFESLLARKGLPLYTLESGIPVSEADIVGVSLGYEPGITGLLAILASGGVPIEAASRGEGDPIVIAGGCGVTNPAPFARFIDAFFIGESEAGLYELVEGLARMKRSGADRASLLAAIEAHPAVWTARKDHARIGPAPCARRAVWQGFGDPNHQAVCFPVPNMRIVQDHGIVEIMRGCPNGCRFCHAGVYYRPQRMKGFERIDADVDFLVNSGGYREISLMSLSSGDYEGIGAVLDALTAKYGPRNVSFQLPSLKVNSFTLPLLERMAEVRKSGLTFAIETPVDAWQLALNKEVYRDRIISIMNEAKRNGWSKAKFYFMIGLPVERGGKREEEEIVDFLIDIQERTRMQCTANVGTFIPKPHTPYQWSRQLSMEEADRKLKYVHDALPRGRFKVSTHRPFNSFLEAMITRGDERVGAIIQEAFARGARLDAWEDWAKPEVWKAVIAEAPWKVEEETIRARAFDEKLPWDGVSLGVSKAWLRREMERSEAQELTPRCETSCAEPCGVCGSKASVAKIPEEQIAAAAAVPLAAATAQLVQPTAAQPEQPAIAQPSVNGESARAKKEIQWRAFVSFSKRGAAAFIPHLSLLETWHKAFQRSGLPVAYTEGFNPLPRFEIAQSLSLGIFSEDEIASFLLTEEVDEQAILGRLAESLPRGLAIKRAIVHPISPMTKRQPLSKFLWGSAYRYAFYDKAEYAAVTGDARFREFLEEHRGEGLSVIRKAEKTAVSGTSPNGGNSDEISLGVTVPFALDRPIRDLIAEIAGRTVYEVVEIKKEESYAAGKDGKPRAFFDELREAAELNRTLLAMDNRTAMR